MFSDQLLETNHTNSYIDFFSYSKHSILPYDMFIILDKNAYLGTLVIYIGLQMTLHGAS